MSEPAAIPGVQVWPWPAGAPLEIVVEPDGTGAAAAGDEARVNQVWAELCRANPRLFDGRILSVVSLDAAVGRIVARRESYKRLAVCGVVPTGVEQLGVTGIIRGRDESGVEHVLLGRRGEQTRTHGGLWELAPSGGMEPPEGGGSVNLGPADVLQTLAHETREELGVTLDWSRGGGAVIAVYRDTIASNADLVVQTHVVGGIDPSRPPGISGAWEYTQTRWLPVREVREFDRREGSAVRPPTRAIWRAMGWA